MTDNKLLSRRQVLSIFGAGVGVTIVGTSQADFVDGDGQGELYGGTVDMATAYKIGEAMWKGPLSVRSEIPQEDGNDFMQTDAGDANDQFAIHHYNGGWSKQGLDAKSVKAGEIVNLTIINVLDLNNPQAGDIAYHDGSSGSLTNTEGLACYNGTAWKSQIDNSEIS